MTDNEIFEAVKQRFTDPKVMDLLRNGLADPEEIEVVKRALRHGDAAMTVPSLRNILYKVFDRLLNVVKDDSTTRQMVKQDLRQLQKHSGDSDMSENLDTANVEKAVQHDCAKHVVHETWGKGECIPGEHTLLDDGTVTHYDVMFEHGVEQNVSVADLTILVEMNHGHSRRKKSAMEEEAVTPEGGEDSSKASKKGKLEMPLEKLKAIMEKKKSEAYKAMLRSQGKMEEEVDETDEEYVPTQRSNFTGKHHLKRDHSDELGSRFVFSTDPAKMKKSYSTERGMKNRAKSNVADLKAAIKSSLGKHTKPNLPEQVEQVDEKMLTKAEMKKREEVAKAIKRDQPGMPMGKKMAIATATAKKVAEELVGNQHKIDANKNNKIDAHDFKLLRAKKKTMKEFVEQLAESLNLTEAKANDAKNVKDSLGG